MILTVTHHVLRLSGQSWREEAAEGHAEGLSSRDRSLRQRIKPADRERVHIQVSL